MSDEEQVLHVLDELRSSGRTGFKATHLYRRLPALPRARVLRALDGLEESGAIRRRRTADGYPVRTREYVWPREAGR